MSIGVKLSENRGGRGVRTYGGSGRNNRSHGTSERSANRHTAHPARIFRSRQVRPAPMIERRLAFARCHGEFPDRDASGSE